MACVRHRKDAGRKEKVELRIDDDEMSSKRSKHVIKMKAAETARRLNKTAVFLIGPDPIRSDATFRSHFLVDLFLSPLDPSPSRSSFHWSSLLSIFPVSLFDPFCLDPGPLLPASRPTPARFPAYSYVSSAFLPCFTAPFCSLIPLHPAIYHSKEIMTSHPH